jgi:four helix bundle protein
MRIGSDIAERLLAFSVVALRLAARLPKDPEDPAGRQVASQMIRSATGAGANYEEARAAESRDDFIHKVGVAAKEARETVYWLTLVDRTGWGGANLGPVLREASELAAILGASARTARANAQASKSKQAPTDNR